MLQVNVKRWLVILIISLLSMFAYVSTAAAHVVVYPKETTQGSYEKFTVRVPNEKDLPTIKVEVRFPSDVNISRFEPKHDWTYEFTRDDSERINSVTWTAQGAGLSTNEFGEFNMQGKVGNEATSLSWKAYQTYDDGTVVEWIGAEGSDKPASVTHVKENTGELGHHNGGHDMGEESEVFAISQLPLYLSIGALALGLLSLIISLRSKK